MSFSAVFHLWKCQLPFFFFEDNVSFFCFKVFLLLWFSVVWLTCALKWGLNHIYPNRVFGASLLCGLMSFFGLGRFLIFIYLNTASSSFHLGSQPFFTITLFVILLSPHILLYIISNWTITQFTNSLPICV
jgi:hypothetical protein